MKHPSKTLRSFGGALTARPSPLVGIVVFTVFFVAALWIWLPTARDASPNPGDGQQNLAARLEEHRAKIAALIPITADRPLFQAERRPIAAPDAPATPTEAVLVLVGILGDGDERIALVRMSTSAELYRIRAGERLGQWQMLSVDTTSITVGADGAEPLTLRLDG